MSSTSLLGDGTSPAPETLESLLSDAAETSDPAHYGEWPHVVEMYLYSKYVLQGSPAAIAKVSESVVKAKLQNSDRVDEQKGASSQSKGSTTVVEKPGLYDLVQFAIDHGAVTRTDSGTSFTLSTTPYAIYTGLGRSDSETEWENLRLLRHVGVSATFSTQGDQSSSGFKNWEGGEVKFVLLGSRSPRDLALLPSFRNAISSAKVMDLLSQTSGSCGPVISIPTVLAGKVTMSRWRTAQAGTVAPDDVRQQLAYVFQSFHPTVAETTQIAACVSAIHISDDALAVAIQEYDASVKKYLQSTPELSLSYDYQRDATISDYSTLKLLFGYEGVPKTSLNLNATLDVNNNRTDPKGMALDRVRSYGVEAGATFGRFVENKSDLVFDGKVSRLKDAKKTSVALEAKTDFYLTGAITIPLALTYANRTDTDNHSRLRLNVGLSLNGDTLLGIGSKKP